MYKSAMLWFKLTISRLRDFTESYDKTSYGILKQGPGVRDISGHRETQSLQATPGPQEIPSAHERTVHQETACAQDTPDPQVTPGPRGKSRQILSS